MSNTISRQDLKKKIDNQEDFYLIEVLSEDQFNKFHLPGAINIPQEKQDFEQDKCSRDLRRSSLCKNS